MSYLLIRDLRYGWRRLVRSPAFTLVALASLALAIGANTMIFSMVNATLLRPLPVTDPDRVVRLYTNFSDGPRFGSLSYPDYRDVQARSTHLSSLAAFRISPMSLTVDNHAELVQGALVTGNYFATLGVPAVQGRVLQASDDEKPGGSPFAVVSHRLWRVRFAANPSLVGSTVRLNGQPFTVIGIAPQAFEGTELGTAVGIWVPMSMHAQVRTDPKELEKRGARWLTVVGRLGDGANREAAAAALRVISGQLATEFPATNQGTTVEVYDLGSAPPRMRDAFLPLSSLLMVLVGLVLLIACANLANLLLARTAARRKEIAVCLSLGATRARLITQLLTESTLLAVAGGVAGLMLAYWGNDLLLGFAPPMTFPFVVDLGIDSRVLVFTLVVSLATGVLFGLAPAIQLTKPQLAPTLREDATTTGYRRSRTRSVLVVAQMALSLLLLIATGLFVRSLQKGQTMDPGFDTRNVLLASVNLEARGIGKERGLALLSEMMDKIGTLPGVTGVTLGEKVFGDDQQVFVTIPGYEPRRGESPLIDYNVVGPRYLATMGIPLVRGRDFAASDNAASAKVVIINEAAARYFFRDVDPIGRQVSLSGPAGPFHEIVGVARDAKYYSLHESDLPYLYVPVHQRYEPAMTLHVRTEGDPRRLRTPVERQIHELDADLPIYNVSTLGEFMGQSLWGPRLAANLLGIFGLLALALATMGIYGVIAYIVHQRQREIAIRMALGAERTHIFGLIVGQGLKLAAIGVAIGLVAALMISRGLSAMLFGISALDPISFIGMPIALLGIAALASYLPARRAMAVQAGLSLRA